MVYVLRLDSLREIESTLGVPRSTLSDANSNRDSRFFEELYKIILWKIYEEQKSRKLKQAIRTFLAIDSTECQVHGSLSKLKDWTPRQNESAILASAKLHVIWNLSDELIEEAIPTPGKAADSPIAKTMKIRANCTYIFDRAYNDITFWWNIIEAQSHFVTRLKNYSRYRSRRFSILRNKPDTCGPLWEGEWKPSDLSRHPNVPKHFKLRHIVYRDSETKKVFDFITSDYISTAQEIADIYKKRWAVELLFRWLKGHLEIRSLEPKNTNAITIQLMVAVVVQLLVRLYKLVTSFKGTLWECLRKIRTNWINTSLQAALTQINTPFAIGPP